MKLLVPSGLHLEGIASFGVPVIAIDAAVLAGDIHSLGHGAVHWTTAVPRIRDKPTILVAGSHELYGARDLAEGGSQMGRIAEGSPVRVLNRRSVVIDGVRFLGYTQGTDFQLPVGVYGLPHVHVERALTSDDAPMSDCQQIGMQSLAVRAGRPRQVSRLLRAKDALAMHWIDRDWLRRELQTPFDGAPVVVVTRHAPSAMSVAPQYGCDRLSPAFTSDLPDEFFDVPALWIHGHTHHSTDYTKRRCRVMRKPRDSPVRGAGFESNFFGAGLVVEVRTQACCYG